jgi:hypothetical protein
MQKSNPSLKLVSENEKGEAVPFLINPVPCVQTAMEDVNIKENVANIKKWITQCKTHQEKVIICSAGPSLEKYISKIKEYKEKGYKISCVKHSLPRLLKAGIVPDYCVVLDPRCVIGYSTHGVKRLDLYKNTPESVTFFVASVTDFRTTQYLLKENKRVIGWHRYVDALQHYKHLQPQLGGGSCSALGSIGLYFALGFREMILVGFDSSLEEGAKTKLKTFKFGSKYEPNLRFTSTGELGAQAQEIEELINMNRHVINFDIWSGGLVGNIWKNMQREHHLPELGLVIS